VSYNVKHNEANGEDNRDGENNNLSWNCGTEGPTNNPAVLRLRARQKRNLLATLLFSQGVPMLRAGDELSHSQRGNNNGYCQDNELSWLNWDLSEEKRGFLSFVRRLISLRREHPVFRRRRFFEGRPLFGAEIKDIAWLHPDGHEMTEEEWHQHFARCLGVYLSGAGLEEADVRGRPIVDDDFMLLINAHDGEIQFHLPCIGREDTWFGLLDTALEEGLAVNGHTQCGGTYPLQGRSLALLMRPRERA
jgi:glycogen operon protein